MTLIKDVQKHVDTLARRLKRISSIVEEMKIKKGEIYIEWLRHHADFLVREPKFDPKKMRSYTRGEVIFVNFGFNVGSEIGGNHYALVTTNSKSTNPVVNVIPLGSLEEGQTEKDLHKKEVYIGVIQGLNDKKSYAIPNQLRPISKMRIIKPKKTKDNVIKIKDPAILDKIDEVVVSLYVKGYAKVPKQTSKQAITVEEVAVSEEIK